MSEDELDDDDFLRLLENYCEPVRDLNPALYGIRFRWVDGHPDFGLRHIMEKHGVSQREVEECLLKMPPEVEMKRHDVTPQRLIFWGCTSQDRWLFIACDESFEDGVRVFTPVTAFEPDNGRDYWDGQ